MSAVAVCVCLGAGAASLAPPGQRAWLYIVAALLLGAVMTAAAVHAWMRWAAWTEPDRQRFVSIIFVGGLLARFVLVPVSPYTTHDVARYLWDGSVLAAGHDPWRTPPNAPELAALTTTFRAPAENAHIPTIYPPAAVALFAVVSKTGASVAPWLWKLIVALASAALLVVTKRLLSSANTTASHGQPTPVGADRSAFLPLIAFSPLALFESGIGAHLDILCAVFVAASLLCFTEKRAVAAGLFLGAAAALKLLPAAAALPLFIAFTARSQAGEARAASEGSTKPQSALRFAAAFALFPALTYGGAFLFGLVPVGSLSFFFEKWRFGSLIFPLLEPLIGAAARFVALLLGAFCLLYAALIARRDALRASSWAMAGPLLASPVVFPWYLLPFSAGLAARPSVFAFSVLLLAPLTYEVVDRFDVDASWEPASWPLVTIAVAMVLAFLLDVWRRRTR